MAKTVTMKQVVKLLKYVAEHADKEGITPITIFSLRKHFGRETYKFAMEREYIARVGIFVKLTKSGKHIIANF